MKAKGRRSKVQQNQAGNSVRRMKPRGYSLQSYLSRFSKRRFCKKTRRICTIALTFQFAGINIQFKFHHKAKKVLVVQLYRTSGNPNHQPN